MMRFAVVVFPGSNCDQDCRDVLERVMKQQVRMVWHRTRALGRVDAVILPGGFSYGDYLRTGAIARFSPIMKAVQRFARRGGLVFGICNGFQILCESGLLPGALVRNRSLKFVCRQVWLKVRNMKTPFTCACPARPLKIPIAHGEGNYYVEKKTLDELKKKHQIVFQYCDAGGRLSFEANPNGSVEHIAGVCNENFNVLGMMPHPDRSAEAVLGSRDGFFLWKSMVVFLMRKRTSCSA